MEGKRNDSLRHLACGDVFRLTALVITFACFIGRSACLPLFQMVALEISYDILCWRDR